MMGATRGAGLYDRHQMNVGQSGEQADGALGLNDRRLRKAAALISGDTTLKDAKRTDLMQMVQRRLLTLSRG